MHLEPSLPPAACWPDHPRACVPACLNSREMQFVVFDDAGASDPMRCIIGMASVPLASLAQGIPVEGSFRLTNPVTKRPAGKIVLGLGWHNPLQLPGEPIKGGRLRCQRLDGQGACGDVVGRPLWV